MKRTIQIYLITLTLLSYTAQSLPTWTTPSPLAPTGVGGPEPFSYYSLAANPASAIVINTGVSDVNGWVNEPDLGWNPFITNGWYESDDLLSSPAGSQLYNKCAVLPQFLLPEYGNLPAFGIGVLQGSAGSHTGSSYRFHMVRWAAH